MPSTYDFLSPKSLPFLYHSEMSKISKKEIYDKQGHYKA